MNTDANTLESICTRLGNQRKVTVKLFLLHLLYLNGRFLNTIYHLVNKSQQSKD